MNEDAINYTGIVFTTVENINGNINTGNETQTITIQNII